MTPEQIKQILDEVMPCILRNPLMPDIINCIKAAYALAESEKEKWISVEDRLPENPFNQSLSNKVLVSCSGVVTVAYYDFELNRWTVPYHITHWMPLPQPPVKSVK